MAACCQPHANLQWARFDLWHNSPQKDKSIEEHYANILNKNQFAFEETWPEEVKQTLSCDAFVFNMKNHDLMQKCIWEKATLTWAKEIAKTVEASKAATQHISTNDKAGIHIMWHQWHHKPPPRSKYKGQKWKKYNIESPHKKQKWNPKSPGSSNNKTDCCTRCRDT